MVSNMVECCGGFTGLTVEVAPVAVRNLLTSCPAAPASRDRPRFTAAPLVPSPPAPTSASDSGWKRRERTEEAFHLDVNMLCELFF